MTELILLSVKPEMPQTSRFVFGTSVFRWPEVKMHTEQRVAFESFSVLPKISRHSCVRVFGIICTSLCLLQEFPWILQTLKLCNCKLQLLLAADKFLKVSAARLSQAIPRTPFRFTSWSMNKVSPSQQTNECFSSYSPITSSWEDHCLAVSELQVIWMSLS